MEKLDVFNCSDVFIASYFTDDRGCAHSNHEHTLIYLISGELEITELGHKTVLHAGECAFMRRDNRMWLQKRVTDGVPYRSVVLKFNRDFLRTFFSSIPKAERPTDVRRDRRSLCVLEAGRADVRSLFESLVPFFDKGEKPSEQLLRLKMTEGLYVLLHTSDTLYASLFDFVDPWKIDIIDFMERNFREDLSVEDMAYNTGRSLSTFKRDFKKCSPLSPEQWLIRRRLAAAHELIMKGGRRVSEICFDVGFKNLSHFSKVYKEVFGVAPSAAI